MDEIEKIMSTHRTEFQNMEAPVGHRERFEQKLTRANRKNRFYRIGLEISKYAAVVLIGVLGTLWAVNQFGQEQSQGLSLSDINQEYREVEFYFTSQINTQYEKLDQLDWAGNEEYKTAIKTELNSMDSIYENLKIELGEQPNEERIIQSMIQHYQTKLKVMADILERLENYQSVNKSDTKNQKQYESVEL